jgi:hypothetical protein
MSFAREASKLLTNKYFLYFMVFLAATNMLGYLVTNKLNALIFFALVGLLTFQFSKNMAVVLLVAIIATNFMMSNKLMREGLENSTDSSVTDPTTTDSSTTDSSTTDSSTTDSNNNIATKVAAVKDKVATKVAAVKDKVANKVADKMDNNSLKDKVLTTALADTNNPELNNKTVDANDVEGFGEKFSNNKKGGNVSNVAPRIDYAATIEQSYQQLDDLLGSDSIKQLTTDTTNLMSKQQELFNTMNQMAPALESAKSMLETFDIKSLTDSLKGMTSLNNLPSVTPKSK